ncbi:hypothetical protein NY08_3052 [Rhodococcus sp. B7740]|uniref:O-antigen ligase family protein n=1 Tax=Rhodococcus sp. B7740 TaxID=1564114 RepID=UPI0005D82B8E|nr:O-antigen ligase family protein [Rhodococcus sp. B7740]AJW41062.1 hypothetical protein NY08_3052 [Rhodococcus sp. B7740]
MPALTSSRPRAAVAFQGSNHDPVLVVGACAVALLVAATRWGSYIGIKGLYLTDVLLLAGVAGYWVLLTYPEYRSRTTGYTVRSNPGLAMQAFALYVVLRICTSSDRFLTSAWIRDAVPFAYVLLAVIAASAASRSTDQARLNTMKLMWAAMLFHLAWSSVVILGRVETRGLPRFPGAEVPIGTIRPDIDCAILGVTAALLLRRVLRRERIFLHSLLFALSLASLAATSTRAGFLAAALALSAAFALIYSAAHRSGLKRVAIVTIVLLSLVGLSLYLPTSEVGQRLIATVNPDAASAEAAERAVGTSEARNMAWERVIEWTERDQIRQAFGAGAGPNFIVESGASTILQGTEYRNVRSPHNYFVGLYARMGTLGVLLYTSVLAAVLWCVWCNRRRIGADEFLFFCTMLVITIGVVSTLGVVLESPFGAVPFWWAAGTLLALGGLKMHRRKAAL